MNIFEGVFVVEILGFAAAKQGYGKLETCKKPLTKIFQKMRPAAQQMPQVT